MFGKIGAPEILIILVVFLLIFGARRLPDMARSLGQSMRILKSETKAMRTSEGETTVHGAAPAHAGSAVRVESAGQDGPPHEPHAMPEPPEAPATAHIQETVSTR
ncbi:Sec-independent protein translocase subunit TatA [Streptomyces sp. AM8-1-1]|uniref:Sec-independent protein translocase subunit TatA n=1 Tax=Streptomyces sp. AM8-1-1 TaxID=3075825 RepID=UPI0028C37D11|nr:Sec-independent protein translocase subunit TatA [Streptomyces sp. AM8-1-1]WNO76643.1 Sec-independent protein translocase subunit TatA [Streptomyces sp. AM8-1-1]